MRSVFWARPDSAEVRRATAGWRQTGVWLPPVIAVILIMFESTDTFSAEHTNGWIRPWVERIFGHINDHLWGWIHYFARKSGHFGGYGMVCLTFLRAWLLTLARNAALSFSAWRARSTGLAIACTALVASLDEWHQTFIPSRTGTFKDVVLDTVGASVMAAFVWAVCWRGRQARAQR